MIQLDAQKKPMDNYELGLQALVDAPGPAEELGLTSDKDVQAIVDEMRGK